MTALLFALATLTWAKLYDRNGLCLDWEKGVVRIRTKKRVELSKADIEEMIAALTKAHRFAGKVAPKMSDFDQPSDNRRRR